MNRAVGFILAGMAAGFVSGISSPLVLGVRGAIFGGALAIGMLVCEIRREAKGYLSDGVTLIAAAVVALAVSLLAGGWEYMIRDMDIVEFGPPKVPFVYTFLTGFLIASGMFLCYRSYSLGQGRRLKALFFWGIPSLSAILRAVTFYSPDSELPRSVPVTAIFCLGVGVFPFLLLWGGTAWLFGFFRKGAHEERQQGN